MIRVALAIVTASLLLLCGFTLGKITGNIPSVADTNSLFYEKRCGITPSSGKVFTSGDFFLINLNKDDFRRLQNDHLSTVAPLALPETAPFWWRPSITRSTVFLKGPGMTPRSERWYIYSPESQLLSYYYDSPSWRE